MRLLLILLLLLPIAATALPQSPSERAKAFATCSGYLGALAVRQRHDDPQRAVETEAMRRTFETLLEAILPAAAAYGMPKEVAFNWRFQAWLDNAEILNQATMSPDKPHAARALELVDQRYIACRDLILPA